MLLEQTGGKLLQIEPVKAAAIPGAETVIQVEAVHVGPHPFHPCLPAAFKEKETANLRGPKPYERLKASKESGSRSRPTPDRTGHPDELDFLDRAKEASKNTLAEGQHSAVRIFGVTHAYRVRRACDLDALPPA